MGEGRDPCRRMRGEPELDRSSSDQAGVWIAAYRDMAAVAGRVVDQARVLTASAESETVRRQLTDILIAPAEAESERMRRRLQLWTQRQRELDGGATRS